MSGPRAIARGWRRILAAVPVGRRRWAVVAIIGWWLSPLTAWNDTFTNIPLAVGLAWILRAAGLEVELRVAAVAAYIFTNVLGIVLLWIGVGRLSLPRKEALRARNVLWTSLRILVYAGLAYVTVWFLQVLLSGARPIR